MALPVGNRPNWLAYLVLVLILYLTAFSLPTRWDSEYMAVNTSQSFFDVGKIVQVISVPLCLYIFATNSRRMARMLGLGWIWLAMVLWTFLSTLWSIDMKTSFLGASLLSILLIFTAYLSIQMDERTLSRALAVHMIFLCTFSILMGLLIPSYGLMNSAKFAGLLRGPYSHKNLLADVISLLLLWLMCAYLGRILRGWLILVAMALGVLVLIWTWSTTAILMILFCLGPIFVFRSAQALRINATTLTALVVIFVVATLIIVPLIVDPIVSYFGKDLTFSGRDVIWQAYVDLGLQRPLTGYGYAALQKSQEYGIGIRFANGSRPSPHNSFIQLFCDLGFPGMIIFIAANILLILDGVKRIGRGDRTGMFRAVFPIGYAINGMMEATGALYISLGLVGLFYLTMRKAPLQRLQLPTSRLFGMDSDKPATAAGLGSGRSPIEAERI